MNINMSNESKKPSKERNKQKMKGLWADFKKFIKRGNVVDMAVGVAVASAFTAIVTAFTKGFISPLIALISGHEDMSEMKWIIKPEVLDEAGEVAEAEIAILWGSFLQAIINFLMVAAVLFTVMRIVASVKARAERLSAEVRNRFTDEDEKRAAEEAEAKAKAEEAAAEEARLAAEAAEAAAEAERLAAEELAKEKARIEREEALITEIRDLLKSLNEK